MSASLVGSEMCIRDSFPSASPSSSTSSTSSSFSSSQLARTPENMLGPCPLRPRMRNQGHVLNSPLDTGEATG
eukprot:4873892-Alexandrium_andersonii.AAC.1